MKKNTSDITLLCKWYTLAFHNIKCMDMSAFTDLSPCHTDNVRAHPDALANSIIIRNLKQTWSFANGHNLSWTMIVMVEWILCCILFLCDWGLAGEDGLIMMVEWILGCILFLSDWGLAGEDGLIMMVHDCPQSIMIRLSTFRISCCCSQSIMNIHNNNFFPLPHMVWLWWTALQETLADLRRSAQAKSSNREMADQGLCRLMESSMINDKQYCPDQPINLTNSVRLSGENSKLLHLYEEIGILAGNVITCELSDNAVCSKKWH